MQTEISNASDPLTAQTYPTFVPQPHGIPTAADFLFCTSCYRNMAAVKMCNVLGNNKEELKRRNNSKGGGLTRQYSWTAPQSKREYRDGFNFKHLVQ